MKKAGVILLVIIGIVGIVIGTQFLHSNYADQSVYLHNQEIAEVEANGLKILLVGPVFRSVPPKAKITVQSIFLWYNPGLEMAFSLDEKKAVIFRINPHILIKEGESYSMFKKFGGLDPWLQEIKKTFEEGARRALQGKISPTQIPGNLAFTLPPEYHQKMGDLGCYFHNSEHPEIVGYRIKLKK